MPMPARPLRLILSLPLLVAISTLAAPALAKSPVPGQPRTLGVRAAEPTVTRGRQRIGTGSGVPRALYDVNYRVAPGEPEAMARQYLRENQSLLRLADPGLGDLVHRATRSGRAGTVVRFEQRYQGIPVLAPDIAVTLDRSRRVTYVTNGYEPGIEVASITPAVPSAEARGAALGWLGVSGGLAHDATRLVIAPEGKAARLAWQVRLVPDAAPHGDWEVLVDARTGEVFRVQDHALRVNGTGFVFDPDPLGTAQATYGTPGYSDGADAATAQLNAARSSRTLLDLTDLGGGTMKLEGPHARIVDTESPFKGLFTQAGTTFNFDRSQDAFEAVNAYYHIDQFMRHVNVTLGLGVVPYQYAGGVRFDPSGLSGDDNSHYITSTGQLAFGEGGVDDAEDADVVIHELGHGLHDWLTVGGLSQVNGLSEGLGDYVAQSYSRSLGQWASNQAPYHWVFSWDGHNEFWPGRVTNSAALYPGGLVGQIHTDGQIWSTCLMRIWNDVGRNKADAAVFEGIAMTGAGSSQNDAAQAVLQAAIALGYTPGEIAAFVTHFQATGYDVSVGIDYVSSAITDECAGAPSNVNGIIEPGEVVEIAVNVEAGTIVHTGVTGVLTSSTPGVTIVDGTATWPNLSPGVPANSNATHFRVAVAGSVPCLSTLDFQLSLTSDQGGPYPMAFSHSVGETASPGGLPLAIPDNSVTGATSTLNVGSNVTLSNVQVRVEIQHTWVGDLFLKLRSPAGTEVVLLDRPGYAGSGFGCGNANMNVTFNDAAVLVPESHCVGTNPWLTGPARAVGTLSSFNGQSSLGDWILTVSDRAQDDVGTLVDWELITTPPLAGGVCTVCEAVVGVSPAAWSAPGMELGVSRPNPFANSAEISFQLARAGRATLRVFDVTGQAVTTLLDRDLAAGAHVARWNGTNDSGQPVAPGIYFYRLASGDRQLVRRMLRVR